LKNLNQDIQASEKILSILKKSKEQSDRIVNDLENIFLVINQKNEILKVNDSFKKIMTEDYLRANVFDFIQKEFHQDFQRSLEAVIEDDQERALEIRLNDDRLFSIVLKKFNVLRSEEGVLLSISGSDITKLRSTESQILDIMNTVNLGILFVDKNYKILPGFSNYSKVILEDLDIQGKNIQTVLFDKIQSRLSTSESRALILMQTVIGITENEFRGITFMLPEKIELESKLYDDEKKILKTSIEPILKEGIVDRYMLVLQDVTSTGENNEATFNTDLLELITGSSRDAEKFDETFLELNNIFNKIIKIEKDTDLEKFKGDLHSIKGALRVLKLEYIAGVAHELETVIAGGALFEEIQSNLQALLSLWEKFNFIFNALKTSDNDNTHLSLFDSLADKKNMNLRSSIKENILARSDEKLVDLQEIENFVQDIVVKNVIDLEIDADFECNIEPQYISSLSFYSLRNALMHFTNNSFAHGFTQGESYFISTSCEFDEGTLNFTFKDNGKGIDTDKIRNIVSKKSPKKNISKMSDDEIARLIFTPDLSTKDEVDELAGRGVGLSAALYDIRELGGDIEIVNYTNGTEFKITLPFWPKSAKCQNVLTSSELVEVLELFHLDIQNSVAGIVHIDDLLCLLLCVEKNSEINDLKSLVLNELKASQYPSDNLSLFREILHSKNYFLELDHDSLNLRLDSSVREEFNFPEISMELNLGDEKVSSFNDYFKKEGFDFDKNLSFTNPKREELSDSRKKELSRLILDFYINFYELTSEEKTNEKNTTS